MSVFSRSVGRFRYLDVPAPPSRSPYTPTGTLVLLHGFPLNPTMWEPQLALAARGWRIIVPELRGFGEGTGDPPTTSIEDYAADTIDLMDALHLENAVIGGLSMGGYIAFAIFRHRPGSCRGIVLADTRAEADTAAAVEGRKRMAALVHEKGQSAVAEELLPKLVGETTRRARPDVIDRLHDQIVGNSKASIAGALMALMSRPDSTSLLPAIHCPTLIVVGDEDVLTPPALSESMHRVIPGSELIVIHGAGHVSNMEQPELFNEALARFLDSRV